MRHSIMKFVLLIGVVMAAQGAYGQDIMIQKNGDELQVKVLKISRTEVEYKKWSNPDGPSYTIPKGDIFMIKYQNGDKDVFKETESASSAADAEETAAAAPEAVKAKAATDNQALIEAYNQRGHSYTGIKQSDKPASTWFGSIGVASSSILSSEEVEISFAPEEISFNDVPYNYNGETIKGLYAEKHRTYRM